MQLTGIIEKMHADLANPIAYELPLGEELVPMNPLLGRSLRLKYSGEIHCIYCGRQTRKSFGQGYCYPCFRDLARCDSCIVKPEQCHFAAGTCREPEWGQTHCMQPHIVYLANTSGLKVGITRLNQIPTRWIDQGAVQALPMFQVLSRYHSGLLEVQLKRAVSDRTDWRRMLKGAPDLLDLPAERRALAGSLSQDDAELGELESAELQPLTTTAVTEIDYPVLEYPTKVTSFNFDKHPEVAGTLLGIKGQYLIFDTGVINMRKFGGYRITLQTSEKSE